MNLILLEDEDFVRPEHVVLRGRRLDHARKVHRAVIGQELVVGRLGGAVGCGTVVALDEREMALEVTLTRAPPPKLPLTLILALPRPKTLRRVLQAVATLGIARLVLVNSWRVEKSFWKSPALAPERLRAELCLGLEQARDTILPEVETRRLLRPFVEREVEALTQGSQRLIAHPAAAAPCPRAVEGAVNVALGPEGGFLEREVELFARHGFMPVTLGERPLRVEQAVAALVGRIG